MKKLCITLLIGISLIISGYVFGLICSRLNKAYELLISVPAQLLTPAVLLLSIIAVILVLSGLTALLVRPFILSAAIFLGSAVAIISAGGFVVPVMIFAGLFFMAEVLFVFKVHRGVKQAVDFSLNPVRVNQSILVAALAIVVCGSIAMGAEQLIKKNGVYVPDLCIAKMMDFAPKPILQDISPELRADAVRQIRRDVASAVNAFLNNILKRYRDYLLWIISGGLFMLLFPILCFLSFVPLLLLKIVLMFMEATGGVMVVTETVQARRLRIE